MTCRRILKYIIPIKKTLLQNESALFYMAPKDSPICNNIEYGNACFVVEECGIGLTQYGYYPCIVSAVWIGFFALLDRILGKC